MQYELDHIRRKYQDSIVQQRAVDGYVNALALCEAAGKSFSIYHALDETKAFIQALAAELGYPKSDLIQHQLNTNPPKIWVHPQVAINLAQWLSPEFAVHVSNWVMNWLSGSAPGLSRLPFHLQRYLDNFQNVPEGHFSILVEMTQVFIAPLEAVGIMVPEHVWPDISQGKMFCAWLRARGYDPDSFPTYKHVFRSGRPTIWPKAYPDELLADFRHFLRTEWMPKRMPKYVRERIPEAIPYLPKLLPKRRA